MLRRFLDSPYPFFVLAGLVVVAGALWQFEIEFPKRSQGAPEEIRGLADREDLNVVFIVIDTLRADRLGSYGYSRDTSPTMDAIANTGVRFANVESQSSWTKASMASLWTGMYPRTNGIDHFSHAIPSEALLPAEILKNAGFKTGAVIRNGWVMPNFGFAQGFDLYIRPRARYREGQLEAESPLVRQLTGNDLDATESAIEFIRTHQSERFFVYVHLMDVHQYLYDDASMLFGTSYSDIYDNAIHWVDRNVSALVSEIEDLGLAEKTVIAIASDHGEAFLEHGVEGHAKNLFREVQDVPFILFLPFFLEPGIEVETRVANIDIWPTLLDLLGLPPIPGAEGKSLVPLILAAAEGDESKAEGLYGRPVYSQLNKAWGQPPETPELQLISVVDGPYRFIRSEPIGQVALYNHDHDATESENLVQAEDEKVEDFNEVVKTFLEEAEPAWGNAPEVQISDMRLGQLRALGYAVPQMKDPKREWQIRKEEKEKREKENAGKEDAKPADD